MDNDIIDISMNFDNLPQDNNWNNYKIDWRLFTYLKKDFWKQFI